MHRRDFLHATAASATTLCLGLGRGLKADEAPEDLRITRVVGFTLSSRRPKLVGKNSFRDVHGDHTHDPMIRILTNSGIEGIGWCSSNEQQCSALLGKGPFDFYRRDEHRINSPLGHANMPLWDLVGNALNQPVWKLLGSEGPEQVPVYDGSIYFSDMLSDYEGNWRDRFRQEIDMGFERGHRFFKVKIGRGKKWMPQSEGDDRDVEVIQLIAQHGGGDITIGVDANNGYDPAAARRFVERVADVKLAFVEEMFPETIDDYLRFKEFLATQGNGRLLADGENAGDLNHLKPYIEARAIDVLQADMNHFGLEGILEEARLAQPAGATIAPHNWGSLLGFYHQLHVGRAIPNFYRAEHDAAKTDILIAEGYEIADGAASVPKRQALA